MITAIIENITPPQKDSKVRARYKRQVKRRLGHKRLDYLIQEVKEKVKI